MYLRKDWIAFLELYLSTRPSLKVLFHLVDSRHGVSKDDKDLMKLYASSKCAAKYVIILTKVDKTDGKVKSLSIFSLALAQKRGGEKAECLNNRAP